MLLELRVQSFAVIERAATELGPGLNVVTGESGAGKSVLLSALALCLGARSDPAMIRTGSDRAVVTATFSEVGDAALERCRELGLPDEEPLLLTRELSAGGRTAARVNGSLVPASALRELGGQLVSLQVQGASTLWLKEQEQLDGLDRFAGPELLSLRAGLTSVWHERQELTARLAALRDDTDAAAKTLVAARQDLAELEAAQLVSGEDVSLRREREVLSHSGHLREAAQAMYQALAGADGTLEAGACDQLAKGLATASRDVAGVDPALDPLLSRASGAMDELRELQREFGSYLETVKDDSSRLEQVEERLDLVERLSRRFGGTLDAAIARRLEARELLGGEGDEAAALSELERRLAQVELKLADLCGELTVRRQAAAVQLEEQVTADLHRLLMPKARFGVRIWGETDAKGVADGAGRRWVGALGWDKVAFELAANAGDRLRPLSEVASGGELSRLALVLLARLAGESGVATVVFDEIDQGLGGEAANRVGELLRDVSRQRQVICITHLAAIGARADSHIKVAKSEASGRAVSVAGRIVGMDRTAEVARLLAGDATPQVAMKHAAELLLEVGASKA